jgi:S-DNA-T family DNA segregation ATPase FtsK/SpoIIIE
MGLEVPKIRSIKPHPYFDLVTVKMLRGQTTADFEKNASAIAHAFGSRRCRVRESKPGEVVLQFMTADPLAEIIPPLEMPESPPLDDPVAVRAFLQRVPVGLRDDGTPWCLQVLGKHTLVAGAMGSGKGSVLWSTLRYLGPLIRDGVVEIWAGDPKGLQELGIGKSLFKRVESRPATIASMLTEAADWMEERATQFGIDGTRLHEPTVEHPLILVVIDEIANLTAYAEKAVKDKVNLALGRLLSMGRAPAFSVFAALQDPRKEVLTLRGLFPQRIALKLDSPTETNMVLGDGMHQLGALCDKIKDMPRTEQGVGYMKLDGVREPERVRASFPTDDDIRAMAREYRPGAPPRFRVDTSGTELVAVGVDLNKAFGA